ncbi:MAG TPA: hypothetical protein VGF92_21055 [Stellaceae bacterium]|jgi:hypothetical protein
MAIRMDNDDYTWVMVRNLRPREAKGAEALPSFSDRVVGWAVAMGLASVILLIGAVVTATLG